MGKSIFGTWMFGKWMIFGKYLNFGTWCSEVSEWYKCSEVGLGIGNQGYGLGLQLI